jgi:hypothetical protein
MAGRARSVVVAAAAILTVSALGAATPASAATCAQRVIADWRDGHITGTYATRVAAADSDGFPVRIAIVLGAAALTGAAVSASIWRTSRRNRSE